MRKSRRMRVMLVVWVCMGMGIGVGGEVRADTQRVGAPPVMVAVADGGMVACETEHAAAIGADVLRRGGNAVDASVAVAFALAVTWPEAGNIAGGGFMLVSEADGKVAGIDYREVAPGAATEDMYESGETRFKAKAVGVPGTVRGLAAAHAKYGKLPWAELVIPSASLAADGFRIDGDLAASLNWVLTRKSMREDKAGRYGAFKKMFSNPLGRAWEPGDEIRFPELAATLYAIAMGGAEAFYEGPIAGDVSRMMSDAGGVISVEDLKGYAARWRTPIRGTYFGYELITMSPPSSGGICVPQILGVLERAKIKEHGRWSVAGLHLIAEATRRSFRDRAAYLGDPDFVKIPEHLLEPSYLDKLSESIDTDKTTKSLSLAGEIEIAYESPETTHFSIVDSEGMAVSNTYTLEAVYGSRVVVPGRGILLNNEMGDFNWIKGQTNERGKIGTDANLIEPGKRMLSSMSPTIVKRDGKLVLVLGSPGGRTIINTVSQVLLSRLVYGMSLAEAVEAPRMHHQWLPDRIQFEPYFVELYPDAVSGLEGMGHAKRVYRSSQGSMNAVEVLADGTMVGVADWRRGSAAVGVNRDEIEGDSP